MKHAGYARLCATVVLGAVLTGGMAGPVQAQAWLGLMVGEMVAEQQAAAREQACLHGAPADPDDVKRANTRIERAMVAYFDLTSKSSPREIARVFTSDKPDIRWRDGTGAVPIAELGARLDVPTPERTMVASVVGGDTQTARVIWSVPPAEGSDAAFYAGDFVNEGWLGGWRIWHLAVLPASAQPDVPPAYCHFDPEQSF